MSEYDECTDSLVDRSVLTELRADVGGDQAIVNAFVRNYVAMLPWRVARLHHALDNLDLDEALDAVLSLKTSSHMVGAICLRRLAAELEIGMKLLSGGEQLADLTPLVDEIDAFVSGTISQLESSFS